MSNPNPLHSYLGTAGRAKKPNNLVLTLGMVDRLRPNASEQPIDFLNRIFDACFTKPKLRKQFATQGAMATAAQRSLPEQFMLSQPNNTQDQRLLDNLKLAAPANVVAIAGALRDLIRGYTDSQVAIEATQVSQAAAARIARVATFRAKNEKRRRAAQSKDEKALAYQYRENRLALARIATDLAKMEPNVVAHENLWREVRLRRYRPLLTVDLIPADTFLDLRITGLDPDLVDFPLRHLMSMDLATYHQLVKRWKQDQDKPKLVLSLKGKILRPDFFDSIDQLATASCFGFDSLRLAVFAELRDVALQGRLQSAALIAVTQSEGLLWTYAHHLQNSGTPVFKARHERTKVRLYLYAWNPETRRYRDKYGNGRLKPQDRYATSGPILLKTSVLQEAMSAQLYTFLLDEFFDEQQRFGSWKSGGDKAAIVASAALPALHASALG